MIAIQKIGKSFLGALNYNLKKLYHPDPALRAELLDSNFASLDSRIIRQELQLVRSLRPNLNRYVYHTSLNFSKEDRLDNNQLLDIAHAYLKESGYTNNQYLIFRHYDADHPHIHLLVNRISFDGTVVSDSNNFKKSEAILRRLELKYQLTKVEDSQQSQSRAVKKDELEMVIRTGRPSDKILLQEKMKVLLREPNLTIPGLIKRAGAQGIHFLFNQASTGRVSGITYCYGDLKIRGQALGNQFKWAEIIKKVDYEQVRDSQAISQANDSTRTAYGQQPGAGEQAAGGERRNNAATALPDAAELAEQRQIHEGDSRNTGKDLAEDGSAATGMETAAEADHSAGVLFDNWGNRYIPPFAVQITDDEDDALKRRKRRGIGR